MNLALSEPEALPLKSAFVPIQRSDSWKNWSADIRLEDAPHPELRLLPAVHAHLTRIAPDLKLPQKLRGKARATFTRNQLIARANLSAF
jgi:hypothetical protein